MTSFLMYLQRMYISWQFLKFLAVGGAAALLHWLARFGFDVFLDFGPSVVLAYGVGILIAFVLNRVLVFPKSVRPVRQEIVIFTFVNIASFPLVVAISVLMGIYVLPNFFDTDVAKAIGHGLGVLSPVLVNFAAHKLITFKVEERGE